MILVGANREKINHVSLKRRYWPQYKHIKQKKKHVVIGSRMYYEMQLEKYRIINQQLYAQFCVERDFNNQMYREEARRKKEMEKLSRMINGIYAVMDDWTSSAAYDDGQAVHLDAESCLQSIMSIIV